MRVRLKRQSPSEAPEPSPPARPHLRLVDQRVDAAGRRRQDPRGPRDREAREDKPADQALYHCDCGFVFAAGVTTSVHCPHCGSGQAW